MRKPKRQLRHRAAGLLLALLLAMALPSPAYAQVSPPPVPVVVDPNQIWRVTLDPHDGREGPEDAPVKVVVFGALGNQETVDFLPILTKLRADWGDQVQIRFKHKTLAATSLDVQVAAETAMACQSQGKFWPFLQAAARTTAITPADMDRALKVAGCDPKQVHLEVAQGKWRAAVLADGLLANEIAAHTFPNVLVNGMRLSAPKTLERLNILVEGELKKAQTAAKRGVSAQAYYVATVATGKFYPQLEGPPITTSTYGSPSLGKPAARIEVQVFAGFECPYCAKLAPQLRLFQARFPNDVRIVWKHMPLTIHPHAWSTAQAAMAADAQGKFWQYHDVLLAHQDALEDANLESYAQDVGLDVAQFRAALEARTGDAIIERDVTEAETFALTGTPTVFLNGLKYAGPKGYPPEGLEAVARGLLWLQ